ncbi:MAG: hypothetical protein ACXVRE_04355 [Gaiellaceae bacterium]
MLRYLLTASSLVALLFVGVTFAAFMLFFRQSDSVLAQCGGPQAKPACLRLVSKHYGLNRPLYAQYATFVDRLVVHQSVKRRP